LRPLLTCFAWLLIGLGLVGADDQPLKRVGMIGLDTSHAPAFAKLINQTDPQTNRFQMKVVAAFPGGSDDLAASRDRVVGFTQQFRDLQIEIVDSIDNLMPKVDAVLLTSVDGRKHLQQVTKVFQAGKPVFIDKPLAADLTDAIAIDLLAKKYSGRWFSSSSLRFSPSILRYRSDEYRGKILGATAWSPCSLDPTHVDLFWYGIHGVETLYTAMGTGCQSVTQVHTDGADVVVGKWNDGRIGTFRGIRTGASNYGMVVFCDKEIEHEAKYEGYEPLVEQIDVFFAGKAQPVSSTETLEIMTFMQAAAESKRQGGIPVELKSVWQSHEAAAQEIVARIVSN
jgi:Oxidoreductase family, NAD-binding Rossmann fold